jgi:hypothetical protein
MLLSTAAAVPEWNDELNKLLQTIAWGAVVTARYNI